MRVALLTREYPPTVYGGAGVHVAQLGAELARLVELDVHCMGEPRDGATAHSEQDPRLSGANATLQTLSADLSMAAGVEGADVVHSHTWYANLGGHLAKLLYGVPHVLTAHSLEPKRPWKAEQLGGGYRVASWAEATAYAGADAVIAVSEATRADVLEAYPNVDPARVRVISNGIDVQRYRPRPDPELIRGLGLDLDRPYVIFVGRITRQKGVLHLLRAARHFDSRAQILLLAGAADTPELARESEQAVAALRAERDRVIWIEEMLPQEQVMSALTHAAVFCCPSIYEPQGIVNLEAMACETPVVASAVGGIPEVVVDGKTGLLVPYEPGTTGSENGGGGSAGSAKATGVTGTEPAAAFEHGLAEAVNVLLADPTRAAHMGRAGRARAAREFSWSAAARATVEVYRSLVRD